MSLLAPCPDEHKRLLVWQKATPIIGYDPAVWRRDQYGYTIRYADYGDRSSEFGWEIDHISPSFLGGGDELGNLRPLHWRKNASLGGLARALLG